MNILALITIAALSGPGASGDGIVLPKAATDSDFYDDGAPSREKVELGRLLFFDKLLSGNENISCAHLSPPRSRDE